MVDALPPSSWTSSLNFATQSLPSWIKLDDMGLLGWLAADVAINWIGWAFAAALKTEVFYDALGSVSFAALTLGSFFAGGGQSGRKILVTAMVGAWTLRLGGYLIARITRDGHDTRFSKVKNEPGTFFIYWTMQALWVYISIMPVLLVNGSARVAALTAFDAFGVSVFATGLVMETVADAQKWIFKANPENKGKFISTGLWSVSRHPNYFGEILVWVGVFVTCCPTFSGWQWASVASPLCVALLLTCVSGVPILEKQADKRWGNNPEYRSYKENTPVLLPWPLAPRPGPSA